MKTRIRVYQSVNYKGYFWEVQGFYPLIKGSKKDWHSISRGGYALTMWGAKWAAKRNLKKRQNFNSAKREWIFDGTSN